MLVFNLMIDLKMAHYLEKILGDLLRKYETKHLFNSDLTGILLSYSSI